MKIAFFVGRFPVLSETFILNQITGLIDRGHEVDIFAHYTGELSCVHADVQYYRLMERSVFFGQFPPAMPPRKTARLFHALALLFERRRSSAPLLRSLNFFRLGRKAVTLRPFFQAAAFQGKEMDSYDVVHAHFGIIGNLCAVLKCAGITSAPLFTTFYGYDITRYVQQNGPQVYRTLFAQADKILCLSRKMRNELIDLQCDERKIEVHHLGVDTSRFAFSPREPRGNGAIEIVTPARLVEKKGLEYAIRAVAKLAVKYPLVQYRIAGDGPLRSHLQGVIDSLNLNSRVHLLGWQTQEQVIELFRNADFLLAPSVTAEDGDQEGTPTVLIEALAQGLPVVSTFHSGIPEIVQEGESGFLAPERNVEALAERAGYLIDHPELWSKMGRAGRTYVEQHFDINKLNDRLVQLYHHTRHNLTNFGKPVSPSLP